MKTFKDLVFSPHRIGDGVMSRMFFANGYGVSVVRFSGSYGYPNLWELAVLKGTEDVSRLTYETPVTEDVLGHLTEKEVSKAMKQVQQLTPAE